MTEQIADAVHAAIVDVLGAIPARVAVEPDTSLAALGFDSLSMLELAVALEQRLGIKEFPMQRWADAESTRTANRFTVGSLTATCSALLTVERQEVEHAGRTL